MSKALSLDLRQRVVAAVRDEGLSHRAAAARFKVSAASIRRWRALARRADDLAAHGLRFGYGTLWRFFARHRLTRKKDGARR
jgi:transposase-like protein